MKRFVSGVNVKEMVKNMNNKLICRILALSYVDNFDVESEEITVCGYDLYHGLALIATYFDNGVPKVNLVSFDGDEFDSPLDASYKATVAMEEVLNPLVRSYDNALRLFLLAAGSDLHCITLIGWDNLGYNRFDVSHLLDLLYEDRELNS